MIIQIYDIVQLQQHCDVSNNKKGEMRLLSFYLEKIKFLSTHFRHCLDRKTIQGVPQIAHLLFKFSLKMSILIRILYQGKN